MKLGLGTAALGRPQYINIKTNKIDASSFDLHQFENKGRALLDYAYQQGIRHFDTAPGYGIAESLLLKWMQDRKHADVSISTKWGYTYVANFDPNARQHEIKEHSLSKLKEQWFFSKQLFPNLTTYQIHSATLDTGVLENQPILQFLYELKKKYSLKIGLTSSGVQQNEIVEQAMKCQINGEELFDSLQMTFNLFIQDTFTLAQTWLASGKELLIKEALANGRIFPQRQYPHYQKYYAVLMQLSERYQVGIDAIALRYCMDTLPGSMVLSGVIEAQHLDQNLQSLKFQLNEEEISQLRQWGQSAKKYWSERKQLAWN